MKNGSAWETLLAFYQASQVWTYSPADATYREMTAAGELGLLPDVEINTIERNGPPAPAIC